MIRRSVISPLRRGSTLTAMLLAAAILGGFVLTAVIIRPGLLHASSAEKTDGIAHLSPERREVLEGLAALVGSSAEVIAVHQRRGGGEVGLGAARTIHGSPYVEIVMRLRNPDGTDFIAPGEIAVLSHSRVLQTITLHHREGRSAASSDPAEGSLLPRRDLVDPSFTAAWRSDPEVSSRVIAAGVSDLNAQFVQDGADRAGLLRLTLTWPPKSADGGSGDEQGSVLLAVNRTESRE